MPFLSWQSHFTVHIMGCACVCLFVYLCLCLVFVFVCHLYCLQRKLLLKWKQARPMGAGLGNMGNTCYLNATLQVCPPCLCQRVCVCVSVCLSVCVCVCLSVCTIDCTQNFVRLIFVLIASQTVASCSALLYRVTVSYLHARSCQSLPG